LPFQVPRAYKVSMSTHLGRWQKVEGTFGAQYRGRLVRKVSDRGDPYAVWQDNYEMLQINERFLDCAVYLYPTQEAAERGRASGRPAFVGGTGFLARLPSQQHPGVFYHYAVTNRHVIDRMSGENVFIRLNGKDGKWRALPVPKGNWVGAASGDDVAAAFINLGSDQFKYRAVDRSAFLDAAGLRRIGPGDYVFLVGRYVNVEGTQRNKPCVRCGAISMMPDEQEPISIYGADRPAFLVEVRTRTGFSGSPVFAKVLSWFELFNRENLDDPNKPPDEDYGPWLIGVHAGQVPLGDGTVAPGDVLDSGMSAAVPAWFLADLLDNEQRFVGQRTALDADLTSKKRSGVKLESLLDEEGALADG